MLQFQSWVHSSWDKLLAKLDHMYSHSFFNTAKMHLIFTQLVVKALSE